MMKVYQPLCPDITFRLAADLSPDALQESGDSSTPSSTSSSPGQEELKLNQEEEEVNSDAGCSHNNNRIPGSAASSIPGKCARDIYNQGHVTGATSPCSVAGTYGSSPASSLPSVSSFSSVFNAELQSCGEEEDVGGEARWEEVNFNRSACDSTSTLGAQSPDDVEDILPHGVKRRADDAPPITLSLSCRSRQSGSSQDWFPASQGFVVDDEKDDRELDKDVDHLGGDKDSEDTAMDHQFRGTDHQDKFKDNESRDVAQQDREKDNEDRAIFKDNEDSAMYKDNEDRDVMDTEDTESVEDVSISHNVPSQPPPEPSPTQDHRMGVMAAEEPGGASGSSSDAKGSGFKPHGMRLDIQRPTFSKYQGHYTLACDVTPSPMQEHVTLASSLGVTSAIASRDVSVVTTPTSGTGGSNNSLKVPRRPRKLPEIPRKHQGLATASSSHVKSIFDEIQEALIKEVETVVEGDGGGGSGDVIFDASSSSAADADAAQQYPYIHKHMGHLFDKKRLLIGYASSPPRSRHASSSSEGGGANRACRSRNISGSSVLSAEAGAAASVEEECGIAHAQARGLSFASGLQCGGQGGAEISCSRQERRRKNSDGDGSRRHNSLMSTPYQDLEVTHRGMHRFIPRHADEVQIGIGDPIHVIREYDDLWCEGVNLRSGERGIFPAMYANDLNFLEDSDGDDEHWKFTMRFLGAVEVTASSGDFALCQAINKVAQQGRIKSASLCTLEINQYGIRMIDKSKEGHESQKFTNFYALKNISFCGTHPSNNRYFAFITKHPREIRFACHVFHSDRSTHRARDALGKAFKRFYQEYMAFTHPTEDIWIE